MFLTLSPSIRIYAATTPTDMRKGFDGLSILASTMVAVDPLAGHLFLFCNRRRTQLRVLFWDGTGWCLFAKRLAQGTFQLPSADAATASLELDAETLQLILAGIELGSARRRKRFRLPKAA